eukprot:scaffold5334_cov151-Pinguiococcus_pyrenoidosus.AAC.1
MSWRCSMSRSSRSRGRPPCPYLGHTDRPASYRAIVDSAKRRPTAREEYTRAIEASRSSS